MTRVPRPIADRVGQFVRTNGKRLLRGATEVAEVTGRARNLLDVVTEGAEALSATLQRSLSAAKGTDDRETPSIGVRPAPPRRNNDR